MQTDAILSRISSYVASANQMPVREILNIYFAERCLIIYDVTDIIDRGADLDENLSEQDALEILQWMQRKYEPDWEFVNNAIFVHKFEKLQKAEKA